MRSSHLLAAVAVLAVAAALVGTGWSWGQQRPAVAATHERAVRLFDAMETYPGSTALDQAREARRYGGVDIMVAHGDGVDRVIVLAVTATSGRRNNLDLWPTADRTYAATRCYRWTPQREWGTADEVACPAGRRVDRSAAPPAHPVTPATERLVARLLHGGGPPRSIRASLAGTGADVVVEGDTVAVAVPGVSGYASGRRINECLLGRRRHGAVEVWRPSAVQVAPGEASCDAATALAGSLQAPTH